MATAPRHTVRKRVLPAHLAAARPGRPAVWDVTEAHTARPVPYGVHTCPDRARAHASRLDRAAAVEDDRAAELDAEERAADRARIAARVRRETAEEVPRAAPRPLDPVAA